MVAIRKAVIPIAGLGTRMLPITKSVPKEMLPIVDRPVISYVVQEALEAGIEEIIFVTSRGKDMVADYFDRHFPLEETLAQSGKNSLSHEIVQTALPLGCAVFTRQHKALGLGHAILAAAHALGNHPFAVLLPDMIMPGCLKTMLTHHHQETQNLIAVKEIPLNETHLYGIIKPGKTERGAISVLDLVEKPSAQDAPSRMMVCGRYLLQPEIFEVLSCLKANQDGEIQLTDALKRLAQQNKLYGFTYEAELFDTGSKLGFLQANLHFALQRPELRKALEKTLSTLKT